METLRGRDHECASKTSTSVAATAFLLSRRRDDRSNVPPKRIRDFAVIVEYRSSLSGATARDSSNPTMQKLAASGFAEGGSAEISHDG
jgi:hypothetical protein